MDFPMQAVHKLRYLSERSMYGFSIPSGSQAAVLLALEDSIGEFYGGVPIASASQDTVLPALKDNIGGFFGWVSHCKWFTSYGTSGS